MTTFENAKIGEKVWDFNYGWGVIKNIEAGKRSPIYVRFDCGASDTYNSKGKRTALGNQSLFWDEIKYKIPHKPLPDLEVDTPVIVWNDDGIKNKRHFSHFEDGKIYTFPYGSTSWSNGGRAKWSRIKWSNWELADKETK